MKSQYRDRSVLIHGKFLSEKWDFQDHIVPPIPASVSFRLRSADRGAQGFQQFANPELDRNAIHPIYIYGRLDEPGQGLLEETLAFAEKGETAVSFATGMAAISAAIGIHVKAGDHIVMHQTVYGCTYSFVVNWLSRFGVSHTIVDFRDQDALVRAITPETRVMYFETPCNPTLDLINIKSVVQVIKDANSTRDDDQRIVSIMDNTFATPYGQRALPMGIDFVVHSLTKNLNGFGTDMGGVVIGPRKKETELLLFRKDFGGSLSPKAAWDILVYGIPTLSLRLERQQELAVQIAEFLELHPKVSKVLYPGLESFPQRELALEQMRDIDGDFAPGSLLYFELAGTPEESYSRAVKFCNFVADHALSITLAVSLGQIRTLLEHPASMTHSAIPPADQIKGGISPGGLRMSLGIEDVRDILSDLRNAFEVI